MPQINQRLDVNGSDDKPFPQERNFTVSDRTSAVLGEGRTEPTAPMRTIGQAKYAVHGMGPSIYQDKTRYSADDEKACGVSDNGKAPADIMADNQY